MILSHRIALDPTDEQRRMLVRAAGCARFTWNWALSEWNKQYRAGLKPSGNKLNALWTSIKRELYPWIYDFNSCINQQPFHNLDKAFKAFFRGTTRRPKFKCKGKNDSFYLSNNVFEMYDNHIDMKSVGFIRMFESLRLSGRILSAVVSRTADRWFVSIAVDVGNHTKPRVSNTSVGIDLGISTALVLSDGQTVQSPQPLKTHLKRLARLSRSHSRKKKGSKNREKSRRKLARCHARIANIRKDWTHKTTTKIISENQTVVLEDLHVRGMLANHTLARAISDVGFYEIRRQLTYKAEIYGSKVIVIDRFFPSSKLCSNCGHKKDVLALSERVYSCDKCHLSLDRDLNAARNILAAGLAVSACGQKGSDVRVTERETNLVEAGTIEQMCASASTR